MAKRANTPQTQSVAEESGQASNTGKKANKADIAGAESRREEILNAAARLFARHGYEATSVRQIAKEVDILSGSLYHHFANKEEMLHEILRKAVVPITEETVRISRLDEDAETKLAAVIIIHFTSMTRAYDIFSILYNSRFQFRNNEEFGYVEMAKREGFEALRSVVQDGVDKGVFRPDLDIYLTIGTIFRILSSAGEWFMGGNPVEFSGGSHEYKLGEVIDYYLKFILNGLREASRVGMPVPREVADQIVRRVG